MEVVWRRKPVKAYRPRAATVTSKMMAAVKNRDSKAEMLLRRQLHSCGLRYRLHSSRLIGKPDIVFSKARLAIFVDGDFWHGRALVEEGVEGLKRGLRTQRSQWWIAKISKTVSRDVFVTQSLELDGWSVQRFWESDVLKGVKSISSKIEATLKERQ